MPTAPHPRPAYLEATTTGRLFRRPKWTPEDELAVVEYDTLEPLRDDTTFDPEVLAAEAVRAGPRWAVLALGAALILIGLGGIGALSIATIVGVVLALL